MGWEEPTFDGDTGSVITGLLDAMADAMPGWQPVESAPEVALAGELGRETAATNAFVREGLSVAAAVGIGVTLLGLDPRTAAPAIASDVALALQLGPEAGVPTGTPTTLAQSVTIPSGFTVLADTGSDQVAFELASDSTTSLTFTRQTTGDLTGYYTATLHVAMRAAVDGTIGNVPANTPLIVVSAHPVVASATLPVEAAGGTDEESLTDYLARVVDYVSLLRPGGVRADDLAALARTVNGVHRALGIDLYDPGDGLYTHERTATVIAIDADGQPVTSTELQNTLDAAREVNFVIHLGEPTYTSVDIAATVTAHAGYDPAAVDADVTAAITDLIDPASWGSTDEDPQAWVERTQLHIFDVVASAARVAGVATVEAVTINGSGATVTLAGPGALPTSTADLSDPSTVTVTVS